MSRSASAILLQCADWLTGSECVFQVFLAHLWQLSLEHPVADSLDSLVGGDALCFGLERSESPKYSAGIDQPVGLGLPFSTVRRKRKLSAPVSTMWARSVIRSRSALQRRALAMSVARHERCFSRQ